MDLHRTVAIVTGGGSGFGAATERHFAANGAKVAVLDLNLDAAQIVANTYLNGTTIRLDGAVRLPPK